MSAMTEALGTLALILLFTLAVIGLGAILSARGLIPPIPDVPDAGTETVPFPALGAASRRPASSNHPTLASTHQLVDSFRNAAGLWTGVCVCGERISRCTSRDELIRVMCVHQAVARSLESKQTRSVDVAKSINEGRLR